MGHRLIVEFRALLIGIDVTYYPFTHSLFVCGVCKKLLISLVPFKVKRPILFLIGYLILLNRVLWTLLELSLHFHWVLLHLIIGVDFIVLVVLLVVVLFISIVVKLGFKLSVWQGLFKGRVWVHRLRIPLGYHVAMVTLDQPLFIARVDILVA